MWLKWIPVLKVQRHDFDNVLVVCIVEVAIDSYNKCFRQILRWQRYVAYGMSARYRRAAGHKLGQCIFDKALPSNEEIEERGNRDLLLVKHRKQWQAIRVDSMRVRDQTITLGGSSLEIRQRSGKRHGRLYAAN